MEERRVDPGGESVTVRCARCADRGELAVAPALAVFERAEGAWCAPKVVVGRQGRRGAREVDDLLGHGGASRLATETVRAGAKGVELRCSRCGLRRRIALGRLQGLVDGARVRRADVVHVGVA